MFRNIVQVLFLFFSLSSQAMTVDWLQPFVNPDSKLWSLKQLQSNPELYDCGLEEQGTDYCSAPQLYYDVEIEGEILVENGIAEKLTFVAMFTRNNYVSLMSNLRKDGFYIIKVEDNNGAYDVIEQLKLKPYEAVDKEVFLKVNQGRLSDERLLVMLNESSDGEHSREAVFKSDGQVIIVTITEH